MHTYAELLGKVGYGSNTTSITVFQHSYHWMPLYSGNFDILSQNLYLCNILNTDYCQVKNPSYIERQIELLVMLLEKMLLRRSAHRR